MAWKKLWRQQPDYHERIWQRKSRQFQAAYMRGWDACIMERPCSNPYKRVDFQDYWRTGYDRCKAGNALPSWYPEWADRKKGRNGTTD